MLFVGLAFAVLASRGPLGMNHGGGTVSAPGDGQPGAQHQTASPLATNSDETRIVLRAPAVGSPVPESLIQWLLALPAVAGVDRYVTGQLADGTTVVGMDPPGAVLLGADGNVLAARLVTGRSLGAGAAVLAASSSATRVEATARTDAVVASYAAEDARRFEA